MKTFKQIVAAVTLLAFAANSVVAMAVPRCCTRPVEQRRSCCQSATQKASASNQYACCAKKQASHEFVQHRLGCCCVKAPLASTSPRENLAKPSFEEHLLDFAFWSADHFVQAPTSSYSNDSPGRFSLSGPPLLALYCIWLK